MSLRVALIQLDVIGSKQSILQSAINQIKIASVEKNACLVVLPESFNCPYDKEALKESAEEIPHGQTSQELMKAAQEFGVYIVGGSIVERSSEHLYLTCPVWSPSGELIAKYRKMHLGDANAATKPIVHESALFTPGDAFITFNVGYTKIGLGICWDMRFPEFASCYQKLGCDVLIYPSLCDVETGTRHWELLARARAVDNQVFVMFCSPARNQNARLVAYGHSIVVDPSGAVVAMGDEKQNIVVADLNLCLMKEVREQIPVMEGKRLDLYSTV